MIKLMDMENICIWTVQLMWEIGLMTNKMVLVKKHGQMVLIMKEITDSEINMEQDISAGLMAQATEASL